jgi:hypothetical protein
MLFYNKQVDMDIVEVKVKFNLVQATKAQRGSRSVGLLVLYPWL